MRVRGLFHAPHVRAALEHAVTHRSEYMWPWESAPHSIAHGILDDETYDWYSIVEGMLESGGWPVVVSEDDLRLANAVGRETGIDVDHTGSAGLAGLMRWRRELPEPWRGPARSERLAVVFSGRRRGGSEQ